MDRRKIELYAAGGAELVKSYLGLNNAHLHARQPDVLPAQLQEFHT